MPDPPYTFGLPGTGPDCGVLLNEANGLLQVQLAVTPLGMPCRWRRPPAVRIAPGDWLRWKINYRFAGTHGGEWTYRLDTLNVTYGPAPVNPRPGRAEDDEVFYVSVQHGTRNSWGTSPASSILWRAGCRTPRSRPGSASARRS